MTKLEQTWREWRALSGTEKDLTLTKADLQRL